MPVYFSNLRSWQQFVTDCELQRSKLILLMYRNELQYILSRYIYIYRCISYYGSLSPFSELDLSRILDTMLGKFFTNQNS